MQVVRFEPAHARAVILQPAQQPYERFFDLRDEDYTRVLQSQGYSRTILVEGRVAGCAGILPQWPGRGHAWCLFGQIPKHCWPAIVRHVRTALDLAFSFGMVRVDAIVPVSFLAGQRFAQMCGLKPEAIKQRWAPDGADVVEYVRIG